MWCLLDGRRLLEGGAYFNVWIPISRYVFRGTHLEVRCLLDGEAYVNVWMPKVAALIR